MIRYREISNFSFSPIFRVFISGCSASGKTHFPHQLLQSNLIQYDRVYYYHPDFHEQAPVTWHESLERKRIFRNRVKNQFHPIKTKFHEPVQTKKTTSTTN